MSLNRFVLSILILMMGLLETHHYFQNYFSESDSLKIKVESLNHKIKRESVKRALLYHQFSEFRQDVAHLLPDVIKDLEKNQSDYPLRNLASIVYEPTTLNFSLEKASSIMNKGKSVFNEKKFKVSNNYFTQILNDHSDSLYIVEAHFLLAEGQFQLEEYEKCVKTLDAMITLFPENPLTGFALLRLAKIYEKQDRYEDASFVYKTIIKNFEMEKLISQAKVSLRAIEL